MEEKKLIADQPDENTVVHPVGTGKKTLYFKLLLIAGMSMFMLYMLYLLYGFYITPDRNLQQIYLVPKDAVLVIQSSEPINDWKKISESEPWKCLKRAPQMKCFSGDVERLDSIVRSNEFLMSLVGKRDMLISIHKTRNADWDMLLMVDLKKTAKIEVLKDQLENVFKLSGDEVTRRNYKTFNVLEIRDAETRDLLYLTFIENHLVASYTTELVHKAIDEHQNPVIGLNPNYIELEKQVSGKGVYRMFVNYEYLAGFMNIYLQEGADPLHFFTSSMDIAGFYLNVDKERIELKGSSISREKADPYLTALLNSGKHTMGAYKLMPARTSVYTHIGISDPVKFTNELEKILEKDDAILYKEYSSSRKKIESLFGISLEENFLSWMSGEFSLVQLEPGLLGKEAEYILAVKASKIKDARKNMELIEKKIRNRTPIRVKSVTYKGYDINYVEMKGFFRLFFGKLFDRFEKPYYTYVGDYVIFSNQASALLSLVEDYEQKNLMLNSPHFKKTFARFNMSSTLFVFTNMQVLFPQLQTLVKDPFRREIVENKEVFYSFPYTGMQVIAGGKSTSVHSLMEFKPYEETREEVVMAEEDDSELSEKELMNELRRFYVEKFQGNILREFYTGGELKSEAEVKEGRKHGRYREYHENGKLKARGKYLSNKPKGTWKYYTEEGKFDRKQKY